MKFGKFVNKFSFFLLDDMFRSEQMCVISQMFPDRDDTNLKPTHVNLIPLYFFSYIPEFRMNMLKISPLKKRTGNCSTIKKNS